MHLRYSIALGAAALGLPAAAAELAVGIEVPRLTVAEYHRPYVAAWIERADQGLAANLSVWYATAKKDGEGTKWLKDLRQWWRRSGRELSLPVDGMSSATRPAGQHRQGHNEVAAKLPAGAYRLVVEAARESGGRELVSIPFQWPPAQAQQLAVQGKSELGGVTLELKP